MYIIWLLGDCDATPDTCSIQSEYNDTWTIQG